MTASFNDDFWLNLPTYPNDAFGNPVYGPENPTHPSFQRFTDWNDLGANGNYLRSTDTKWVYIHPSNWKLWHLAGPGRGKEGVVMSRSLEGVMQPEYEIKYAEGPYVIGAVPQRVNYKKRTIHLGVVVQPNANAERPEDANPFAYRMIEASWWQSWSETVPGYLGSFTRTHGWRWLRVLLAESTRTPITIDPVGNGNNAAQWDMTIHAPWPFFAKRMLAKSWTSSLDSVAAHGFASGLIALPNRGTWPSSPKFLVQGSGTASVQDGIGGPIVTLPELFDSDGTYMLVDTDPTKQTIVTQNDPIDSQIYTTLRNSQILDIILAASPLGNALQASLPAQRRIPGGIGFQNQIPPQTVAHLQVTHTNPNGSITLLMPQYYRMAWS
jgi:hypothetical protein